MLFTNTTLQPLLLMEARVDEVRGQPGEALLLNLLYAGELVAKLAIAGMVAGVQKDVDQHQYRHCQKIVRADGIGGWVEELDSLLTGPTAQFLNTAIRTEEAELVKRTKQEEDWQYQAVKEMYQALQTVQTSAEPMPKVVSLRHWFSAFVYLRNKTRGHGMPTSARAKVAAVHLERAIQLFAQNFTLFKRPWAYLQRTQSSRYHVTRLNEEADHCAPLRELASSAGANISLSDGLYVWLEERCHVALAWSPEQDGNLFFPNGGFNDRTFEVISPEDGTTRRINSAPYLAPVGLPPSETQGLGELDIIGNTFSNLPTSSPLYVKRPDLQNELLARLLNLNRHPVVVLHGRGGIGKTSLALHVLHEVAEKGEYECILWFSARDIDLLPEGPKPVKPHFISETGVAKEYVRLIDSSTQIKGEEALEQFTDALRGQAIHKPILFVFDNFETVQSPLGLFNWIDAQLHQPNKVLITTRIQDFKGAYNVEVSGMLEDEANELVEAEANRLEIRSIVSHNNQQSLIEKADGHPYVIKVLLGEVANQNRWVDIARVVADKENMLTALFERTYNQLTPLAKRIFLTACKWRSTIPVLALKMVVMRNTPGNADVQRAIDELTRSSLIEIARSEADDQEFVSVPLAAEVFGRNKLTVESISSTVQVDVKELQDFGPAQRNNTKLGFSPRLNRFATALKKRVLTNDVTLAEAVDMLEFLAYSYPYAWLLVAELYDESDLADAPMLEREALQRYMQTEPKDKATVWLRIINVSKQDGNAYEEAHAWHALASLPNVPYEYVSNAAVRITSLLNTQRFTPGREEKDLLALDLAKKMRARLSEASGTDCSRLAWLYITAGRYDDAYDVVKHGLARDPQNEYLLKIMENTFN